MSPRNSAVRRSSPPATSPIPTTWPPRSPRPRPSARCARWCTCAGIGNAVRLVNRDGTPGSLEDYTKVINVNLIGSFNVLRLAAASMAGNDEDEGGERGVCVLTASVAAFEGQIGQISYSASKGGVVGMTIVAARDLARAHIRVCTIAPGIMDTPLLGALRDDIKASLAATVPNPSRLGVDVGVRGHRGDDPAQRLPQRRDDPAGRRDPDGAALAC